jgi:hypothetical protein
VFLGCVSGLFLSLGIFVGWCLLGFKVRVFARVFARVCSWDSFVCFEAPSCSFCVLRGALRFLIYTFLTYQKKKKNNYKCILPISMVDYIFWYLTLNICLTV